MNALNLALFQWLAAGNQPTPWVLSVATTFALWGSWLSLGLLVVALWRHRSERAYLCIVAAMAGMTSLVAHAIALSLNVARPFMLGLAPSYIDHAGRGSLPSTHAAVMFMVAAAFMLRPDLRRPGLLLLAVATTTGWARIYVGVHYPLDIVAGLLLGFVIAGALAIAWWVVCFFALQASRAPGDRSDARTPWRNSARAAFTMGTSRRTDRGPTTKKPRWP